MTILKELRIVAGITLREVEDRIGVSNAYLSQLETGKIKKPSASVLNKLAKLYNVSLDFLLDESGKTGNQSIFERVMNLEEKVKNLETLITQLNKPTTNGHTKL